VPPLVEGPHRLGESVVVSGLTLQVVPETPIGDPQAHPREFRPECGDVVVGTVLPVELLDRRPAGRTRTGQSHVRMRVREVFEKPLGVGREVPALSALHDRTVRVEQVHAGVRERRDVSGGGDTREIEPGVVGDRSSGVDYRVDERRRVADDALSGRERVGVGPAVARRFGRDDGGARIVDVGILGVEGVLNLGFCSRRKRTVGQDRQRRFVGVGEVAVGRPEASGVPEDVVDERRRPERVREPEFGDPGGAVPAVDLEVVGHTPGWGWSVNYLLLSPAVS